MPGKIYRAAPEVKVALHVETAQVLAVTRNRSHK
jgi:hypothetical protein